MAEKITLELKRDDACLWLHVTNGQQHGLFNLGSGLRENGQDVLAVQLLRECIAHYAALSQPSTNPPAIGSKLVDQQDGMVDAVVQQLEQLRRECYNKGYAAAPPQPDEATLAGKYGEVLTPFLYMMNRELHANSGKGDRPGWLSMDRKTVLLEIYYHLSKLQKAMKDNDHSGIREYAADVANMSMMAVDVCGLLTAAPEAADHG